MKKFVLLSLALIPSLIALSQPPGAMGRGNAGARPQLNGNFYGKVLEATSGKPIEYASVQLLQNKFDSVSKKRKDQVIG